MSQPAERVVLVSGAARGVGAAVAHRLADLDSHVVVNHRDHPGGTVEATVDSIATRFGRLDALVLDASGGLPFGTDAGQAMRVSRDEHRTLASLAMPLMSPGARIVFVTSHQAHFFPHKAVPKGYTAVAAGMRAGETALYAMRSQLGRHGIHLSVVSGDMIGVGHPSDELADAVVNAVTTPHPPGVVFLGGAEYLMTA
ncbi:hypothetical protein Mycch_5221 [Mycolicibacterium chubuense NBB4]|uniref:Short chain dehydrogenase n=1 Tax=Mycolicibacterium chubuense (strain NBB4) TaxID=710421 RepID=I4BRJ9_MYCCN|nr:short chain dehydrogenase [Mycolicibacterium chubuense]AFM19906.1 hypothetical protein Mycch_5221 [Mycolicibacterium chubuense NBB4]